MLRLIVIGVIIVKIVAKTYDCKLSHFGLEYSGKRNYSETKKPCKTWLSVRDRFRSNVDKTIATTVSDGNYCRNPSVDITGPWCYTFTSNLLINETCGLALCKSNQCRLTGNFLIAIANVFLLIKANRGWHRI